MQDIGHYCPFKLINSCQSFIVSYSDRQEGVFTLKVMLWASEATAGTVHMKTPPKSQDGPSVLWLLKASWAKKVKKVTGSKRNEWWLWVRLVSLFVRLCSLSVQTGQSAVSLSSSVCLCDTVCSFVCDDVESHRTVGNRSVTRLPVQSENTGPLISKQEGRWHWERPSTPTSIRCFASVYFWMLSAQYSPLNCPQVLDERTSVSVASHKLTKRHEAYQTGFYLGWDD